MARQIFFEDFNAFTAAGFASSPGTGQLDSDTFRVTGLSDGDIEFGGSGDTGDFARGTSTGGETTGGVYALEETAGDNAIMFQPSGDDFTPGTFEIQLTIDEEPAVTLTEVLVNFDLLINNDEPRSNTISLAYAVNDGDFVNAVTLLSLEAADANGFTTTQLIAPLAGLELVDEDVLTLQFTLDDFSGDGARDEFALDDIEVTVEDTIAPSFTLELLHFADQEANANSVNEIPNFSAVLNALRDEDVGQDATLTLSSGDAFIPGVFFDASETVFGAGGIADILIQNELGVQAIALGNHEFDLGSDTLAGLIAGGTGMDQDGNPFGGTDFPYLSANLDFSGDAFLSPLETAGGQAPLPNVVTSSTVLDEAGELIGVVGATTPIVDQISSPDDGLLVLPEDFDAAPTEAQLDALAAEIQAEVDALLAANATMNKVILLSHMQQLDIERALAERLTDVDIIVGGGSNTRLFDENDRPRDGDSVQGTYPEVIENAGGTNTLLVNTDGTYKYVGRLVVDFDSEGNVIAENYDPDISGAFATDEQGVTDLGAEGLVDEDIQEIVDAIEAQIIATESNVFGVSDVFLNANRSGVADDPADLDGVRTQETNLGNLTADANLVYANDIIEAEDLGDPVVVSFKNGGGIRANIGEITVPPGGTEAERLPNEEIVDGDGNVVKPAGGISQTDIQAALSFNNGLSLVDITKTELVTVLEGGVSLLPEVDGAFPQIAGVKFSFDPSATGQVIDEDGNVTTEGERIQNAGIFDENDELVAELVRDGEIVGDPDQVFRIVTLNFLLDGGDPALAALREANLSNPNRVDLFDLDADGMDDGLTTGAATFADDGTEQDALAEYLNDNFNPANEGLPAFAEADTDRTEDERIQNLDFRDDTIFGDAPPTDGEFAAEEVGNLGLNGAEIVDFDPASNRAFVTSGDGLQIVDLSDPANPTLITTILPPTGGGDEGGEGEDDEVAATDFFGTDGNDDVIGTAGNDRFFGFAQGGSDTIETGEGFDQVVIDGDHPSGGSTAIITDFDPLIDVIATDGDVGNVVVTNGQRGASRVFVDGQIVFTLEGVDRRDVIVQELQGGGGTPPSFDSTEFTSVSVSSTGIVAASLPRAEATENGDVLFFDTDGNFLGSVEVGPLPDSLDWNEDGTHVVVANEGESNGEENEPLAPINPEGSVSIITYNETTPSASTVQTIGFEGITEASGGRLNPLAPSIPQDIEPEFVDIIGNTAGITLQENNLILVIPDVTDPPAQFGDENVFPAGTTDFSQGMGVDPSNEDDGININPYNVLGLHNPDGHALFTVGETAYVITANEGDAREGAFTDGGEIARGADLIGLNQDGTTAAEGMDGDLLDPALLAAERANLEDDALLGRLEFSIIDGDTDDDGDIDVLNAVGGRSISIFNAGTGEEVFNSGDDFEVLTSTLVPEIFNSDESDPAEFDQRSDDGGPEPEGVVVGEVEGTLFAFVGLERVGGVMVYDVSDPANASFVDYIPPQADETSTVNAGPEGLKFISAEDSPNGVALLLLSSEDSETLAVYELTNMGDGGVDPVGVPIGEIQGDGESSPLEGQVVTTQGIVHAVFQGDGEIGGYFIQDAMGDGDDATSDGLYISDATNIVTVGDLVTVTGTVEEFFERTQLTTVTSSIIETSGNDLPEATQIDVSDVENIDLEAFEGMRVEVVDGDGSNIAVTDNFDLGRFGRFDVASDAQVQASQALDPQTAAEGELEAFEEANLANRLSIDDGRDDQNPDVLVHIPDGMGGAYDTTDEPGPTLRIGTEFESITGALDFTRGDYRVQNDAFENDGTFVPLDIIDANPRPDLPDVGGELQVASFNVLNFFTTIDGEGMTPTGAGERGADSQEEFDRQLEKLVTAIEGLDAEVIGLQEIENNGFGEDSAISTLVDELNTSAEDTIWSFVDYTAESGNEAGLVGTDAITTAFIYRNDLVTEVGSSVLIFEETSADTTFALADVLNQVAPVEDQVEDLQRNRPATAASFETADGEVFTVVNNHLKSKGDSNLQDVVDAAQADVDGGGMTVTQADIDALIADPNFDQNDGQAFWNEVRADAARELDAWIATDPTGVEDPDVLIIGDFNAYGQEEPIDELVAAGFTHEEGGDADDYSFTFFGQQGSLDHAFTSSTLADQVTGADTWHVNADEPRILDYNTDFEDPAFFDPDSVFRASDHDPLIVGLSLGEDVIDPPVSTNFFGTEADDDVTGTDADENFFLFGAEGNDLLATGGGFDQIFFTEENLGGLVTITDFDVTSDTIVFDENLNSGLVTDSQSGFARVVVNGQFVGIIENASRRDIATDTFDGVIPPMDDLIS